MSIRIANIARNNAAMLASFRSQRGTRRAAALCCREHDPCRPRRGSSRCDQERRSGTEAQIVLRGDRGMRLYHFTRYVYLQSILMEGLDAGEVTDVRCVGYIVV